MPRSDRLTYLAYRCVQCKRLLTAYEILDTWERLEKTQEPSKGVCPCGGSKISPSNPTLLEELTLPRVWKLWWGEIARPALIAKGWLR